tara:strand:+ start:20 stop:376 length:357 start_codon:yes stop_codon:yes gene_type:complete
LSEQGKEKAVPIEPAPRINIFAINYSLKINFLIKYNTAIISIFPNIIKMINDILVKLFKSKKFKLSSPYNEEFTVFVRVSMDNLKELSKVKLSKVKILDKTNKEIINEIKTKKAIFTS